MKTATMCIMGSWLQVGVWGLGMKEILLPKVGVGTSMSGGSCLRRDIGRSWRRICRWLTIWGTLGLRLASLSI